MPSDSRLRARSVMFGRRHVRTRLVGNRSPDVTRSRHAGVPRAAAVCGTRNRCVRSTIMANEQWSLGGDLSVNRVGYGTMKLTGWPRGEPPDRDTALAILRRTVELGVNHLDTSNYYARDGMAANELIRTALHPYPDDLVIVTKVGALADGHDITLPAPD